MIYHRDKKVEDYSEKLAGIVAVVAAAVVVVVGPGKHNNHPSLVV